ncbi:MAG TPA: hypothetical protein PL181_17055 [bacterium]|nr:hypothetical protein [bacterium]
MIESVLRDECIRRGLAGGDDDQCGCEFPHIHSKGPSADELLFSSRQNRNPKMEALQRRFFKALMERTSYHEGRMLEALGLPDITRIRRAIIAGSMPETGDPWRYNDVMALKLKAIIKDWLEDLLPVEYIQTGKGISEDILKIKWIIVRFMLEAFGLEAQEQYEAIDALEDGTIVSLVMPDPTKAYFRAMLSDAGRRITTELAVSRLGKVRDALIDMSLKGRWPIEVGRKLHDLIGEGAAWYWLRIARSEATLAANAAFDQMAAANGTNYEEWDAGPGCCIICAWLDGKVWRTGEGPEPVSDTHPHCMCARIATYGRGGHSWELQPHWDRPSPYKTDANGNPGKPWTKEELDKMREQLQPTRGGQFPMPPKEE